MNTITETIDNCLDCKAHKIIIDPEPQPDDWFCDDDEAVVCTLTEGNPNYNAASPYRSYQQNLHRCVITSD